MADVQIVKQLIDRLRTEEAAAQEATAEQIKYVVHITSAMPHTAASFNRLLLHLQGFGTKQLGVLYSIWPKWCC